MTDLCIKKQQSDKLINCGNFQQVFVNILKYLLTMAFIQACLKSQPKIDKNWKEIFINFNKIGATAIVQIYRDYIYIEQEHYNFKKACNMDKHASQLE